MRTAIALCCALLPWAALADEAPQGFDVGMIQGQHIYRPDGQPKGVVALVSDSDGWGAADDAQAKALVARNVAVIGLDLPGYLRALEAPGEDQDCSYAISDIEEISKRLQAGDTGDYRLPVIAGRGDGGGLALALAAQVPPSTVGATIVVDPSAGVALKEPLCTDAGHEQVAGRAVYGLMPNGELNEPVSVIFTKAAAADAVAHVAALAKDYKGISQSTSDAAPAAALAQELETRLDDLTKEGPLNLPISAMPVDKPAHDTLAIIYSGDGGWRDLDREIGENLQKEGIPVVGVDALRYFWNERQPQETADDLARIIEHYRGKWGLRHVLLIGYSFGADILPNSYNLLPKADRDSVVQMTLLALSHERNYEIKMSGWLGMSSGSKNDPAEDLKQVPPGIVQCIFGTDDEDDACHGLTDRGYELIGIEGGHHFDEDYPALAGRIAASLKARLGG